MSHGLSTQTTIGSLLLALILPCALAEAGQTSTDEGSSLFGQTKVSSIHRKLVRHWLIPFSGDWGRSEVYRHDLTANGPTFDLKQDVLVQIPRATGMDIDGQGRLFVASWFGGESAVYVGPNVGFVARVTPKEMVVESYPDLKQSSLDDLVRHSAMPHPAFGHKH